MDLSKLSNEDLLALKSGDLSKVSNAGLLALKGESPKQTGPREMLGMLPAGGTDMFMDELKASMPGQAVLGGLSGASRIGNTLLRMTGMGDDNRSKSLQDWRDQNVTSITGKAADLGAQVAGTAGVGGLLGKGVAAAAPRAAPLAEALATGGFRAGGMAGPAGLAVRSLGGAASGGAAAGLVDPDSAGAGAMIGGALPGAAKLAGMAGKAVGTGLRKSVGAASPEVIALAERAKQLGITVPADRLVNSKPLDAVASGLNYVPFSGRAATEARLNSQLNEAASKLIGQNTSNMTKALRDASVALGGKFDATLKGTSVSFDKQLLQEVTDVFNTAQRELGDDSLKAISSQVDELVAKGASGSIDGQAAYNIKRTLDRIGRRNTPEAWHALELKRVLMDALNRSLGPDKAQAFAKTREQYSNMLALEKLAKNGVEGEISVARIANLPNINNQPLQELADIAAQFVKPREAQHGAMQRAVVGLATGSTLGPWGLAGAAGLGRGTNLALESDAMRNLLMNKPQSVGLLGDPMLYRAAPLIGAQ